MIHNLLATEIVVAPCGAPRRTYGLSVLVFEAHGTTDDIYGRLRSGGGVPLDSFEVLPYEKEKPSLLLSESPMLLDGNAGAEGVWYLSMP